MSRRHLPTVTRSHVGVACAFGALMMFAGAAAAAPIWRPEQRISPPDRDVSGLQLAVSPTGTATAIWARSGSPLAIQGADKAADSPTWTDPQNVSEPSQDAGTPRLSMNDAGEAIAVFRRSNGTNTIVQSSAKAGSGQWGAGQNASAPLASANSPDIAYSGTGEAIGVWRRHDGTAFVIQGAVRSALGAWTAARDLSVTGRDATHPRVSAASSGNAMAVWERTNDANVIVVQAAELAAGAWSPPIDLSTPDANATDPRTLLDNAGNAVAVWSVTGTGGARFMWALRPAGGTWTAPQPLSDPAKSADGIRLKLDPAGQMFAVWRESDPTSSVVRFSTRSNDGPWSAPIPISPADIRASEPSVTVDPIGDVAVAWRAATSGPSVIQVTRRDKTGQWTAPQTLSDGTHDAMTPEIGLDASGNGAVAWVQADDTNLTVHAAGLDAAGPVLAGVIVPDAAVTGERLEMAASPFDVWSAPVTPPAWRLGDGRRRTGTALSVIYRRPGRHTVTVTSSDAIGNATTVKRPIVISPLAVIRPRFVCTFPDVAGPCPVTAKFTLRVDAKIVLTIRSASGVVLGRLTRRGLAGDNEFDLPGRLGKSRLVEGRYAISVRAELNGVRSKPVIRALNIR